MTSFRLLRDQWLLGLCYLGMAVAAIALTRFEGGVAQVWPACAVLVAALIRLRRRHWWAPVLACVCPAMVATGWWGLGWTVAPLFAAINAGEAMAVALLMRRFTNGGKTLSSVRGVGGFVLSASLGPLLLAPAVGTTLWALGMNPVAAMVDFWTAHALGNLVFIPLATMFVGQHARWRTRAALRKRRLDAALVMVFSVVVSTLVFGQTVAPLLFLCSLGAIVATFWLGREGACLFVGTLTVIGSLMTALGNGPILLVDAPAGVQALVLQLFLASTMLSVLPVAADLHRRQALVRRLRNSEAKFRMFTEQSSEVILHLGRRGEFLFVSPAVTRLTGHDPAQLIGRNSGEFVHLDDHQTVWAEHQACFANAGETRRYRHRALTLDGSWRWVEASACAMIDEEGQPEGVVSMLRDVTDSMAEQERWQNAALTDRLTALPNRRALEAAAQGTGPGTHCIALLDLDRFKQVNDTYGHDAGDAVLKGFAEVAARLVRSHDMVARLGGEEFVVLFEHSGIEQAYQVCDRIRRILGRTPLDTPAGPIRVTVSGGVAMLGPDGLDAALKAADKALYRAKRGGRDQLLLAA